MPTGVYERKITDPVERFWSKVDQTGHNGRQILVGVFDTIEKAKVAVEAKRDELFTHEVRN